MNTKKNHSICSSISDESSYNLKSISLEDSQIDQFIPTSSPYILNWQATNCRKYSNHNFHTFNTQYMTTTVNQSENDTNTNVSNVEHARGNDTIISNLVQIPADNTFDLTTVTNPNNMSRSRNNKSLENVEKEDSRLISSMSESSNSTKDKTVLSVSASSSSKSKESSKSDSSTLKATALFTNKATTTSQKANENQEHEKTQVLSEKDLRNVHKRLEFSNLSDSTLSILLNESRSRFLNDTYSVNNLSKMSSSKSQQQMPIQEEEIEKLHELSLSTNNDYSQLLSSANTYNSNHNNNNNVTAAKLQELEEVVEEENNENNHHMSSYVQNINIINLQMGEHQKSAVQMMMNSSTRSITTTTKSGHRVQQRSSTTTRQQSSSLAWEISPKKRPPLQAANTNANSNRAPLLNSNPLNSMTNLNYENLSIPLKRYKEFEQQEPSNATTNNKLQTKPSKTNKENARQQNEISTQTSFLVHTDHECANNSTNSRRIHPSNKLSGMDKLQRQKFKLKIEAQKHEMRVKELEYLAQLERAQADHIKKLMHDMSASNLNYTTDSSSLNNNFTLTSNLTQIYEEETSSSATIEHKQNNRITDTFHALEMVNFNKPSLNKPPCSVFVIKENVNQVPKKQTTDLIAYEDGEIVSRPSDIFFKHKPNPAKTLVSHKNEAFNILTSYSDNNSTKMSLQEAFHMHKQSLIKRSQQRQLAIRDKNEERKMQADYERQVLENRLVRAREEMMQKRMKEGKLGQNGSSSSSSSRVATNRRSMSVKEIKELTRKNYERLPEVKEKQIRERIEREKLLNKVRSSIYNKVIQEKVLSKGPNFGMRFKAL